MKKQPHVLDLSRRRLLQNGMVAAAAGIAATTLLRPSSAQAATKASKATLMYRDTPNGKDSCATCLHYTPGKSAAANGTCDVVDGSISPHGWCAAFAPGH
jgi:hypothetical protein